MLEITLSNYTLISVFGLVGNIIARCCRCILTSQLSMFMFAPGRLRDHNEVNLLFINRVNPFQIFAKIIATASFNLNLNLNLNLN